MTLNALKPSLREKKRYICFETENNISAEDAQKEILSRVKSWIGEKDFATGRVHFMKKLYNKGKGIISCNNKEYINVKAGMLLTEKIKTEIFYVSGSLKKAKEKLQLRD